MQEDGLLSRLGGDEVTAVDQARDKVVADEFKSINDFIDFSGHSFDVDKEYSDGLLPMVDVVTNSVKKGQNYD